MNQRFLSVIVFAFLVAAGASMVLYRLMAKREASAAVPVAKIVVARRNLDLGAVLKPGDLKLADWTGSLPPGAATNIDDLVGRGVISSMYQNEPVLTSRLAAKGSGGGLAAMIPEGLRAVAVRVNEVVGVAGFATPGMRVDVLISGTGPNGKESLGSQTRTLLQNIQVLSAGQNFQKDAEGKPVSVQVVNLLVDPAQAEMLSLASTQATIQLVLRNPMDTKVADTTGTAMAYLFGQARAQEPAQQPTVSARPRPAPPQPAPLPRPVEREPEKFVVEVIHGSKKIETKFEENAEARP
jgi:pilus assembly protein CpaB